MASPDGLVAALARCQAKFPPILKSHTNPAFKGSQYADVADVLAAVRPVLAAEGIVVTQVTQVDSETGAVILITRLMYGPDGEQISSVFPLHVSGLTDQQIGSKLTYTKRYQLCAILAVHPVGDDDDGNLAATAQQTAPKYEDPRPPDDWKTRPLASMTFTELRAVAVELGQPFSGGSKGELIRQLEPLVRAASGEEPWPVEGEGEQGGAVERSAPSRPEPDAIPFEPVVALPNDSGSARKVRDSIRHSE